MKISRLFLFVAGCATLACPAWAASRAASDLVTPQRRQQTVDAAQKLVHRPTPAPLGSDLVQPFNPANFDQPDAEEQKANSPATVAGGAGGATPAAPKLQGNRELLESLAARIPSSGTIVAPGNKTLLILGKHRFEVGQSFTVTNPANGEDCELELVAIDRTTFTLRYRGEEITRPIKSSK